MHTLTVIAVLFCYRELRAQLDQAEAREDDARCSICYAAARDCTLMPCMHRCARRGVETSFHV